MNDFQRVTPKNRHNEVKLVECRITFEQKKAKKNWRINSKVNNFSSFAMHFAAQSNVDDSHV